ncbi:YqjF family protein [Phycisphaerales bacterium AB-hyl4]|uniref:YqjF family protein n=1 Tax=Natronomicrosphaera hydrolytica TaxID=3242702 RepID=A0ABV4TZD7_9BACT
MTTPQIIHRVTRQTNHRPWAMPDRPWVMAMRWHTLLFAHWPVDAARLRAVLPASVELDTFQGHAWLGVVPFGMSRVRLHGLPPVWPVASFLELNVRTYVTVNGKPGVWFFSLDAASRLAVRGARWSYGLPYFDARMHCQRDDDDWVSYQSNRTHRDTPPAAFAARYRPVGPPANAAPGSLEQFLYERYCLYTVDRRGRPMRGDVHHEPWPVQPAELQTEQLDMTRLAGVSLDGEPTLLHYADHIDVIAWRPVSA